MKTIPSIERLDVNMDGGRNANVRGREPEEERQGGAHKALRINNNNNNSSSSNGNPGPRETRSNEEAQRLFQYIPEHTLVGQIHIPTGHQGLKGCGVTVLASIRVAIQKIIENVQGLWVKCD
eukprot:1140076-Pelagomonas_calceolata.AAC.1